MIRTLLALAMALIAAPGAALAGPDAADPQQILVMLHLPPPHVRPGGDYGGRYGDRLIESALNRQARAIARRHGLTVIEDWPMPAIGQDCFVMRVPDGMSAANAVNRVSNEPGVQWSQPIHSYKTLGAAATPDDPLYPAQPARGRWQLDALHRLASGRGAAVAVIDSGIDGRHPDLAGQVAENRNFVAGIRFAPERHGTAVAGIIAARAGNHMGIVGIAPAARLLGLRACWQPDQRSAAATCDSLSLAKALHYSIEHGADVINLSLAGPRDQLLATLIEAILRRGIPVVAAYDAAQPGGGFPASQAGVIAVSDTPVRDGPRRIYVAPGRDIPAPQPGGKWTLVDGSSYAAAHVSGLLGLVREHGRSGAQPILASDGRGINAVTTLRANRLACGRTCGKPVGVANARQ